MATDLLQSTDDIAQELFEVLTRVSLSTQAGPRRDLDLKELEFLTLSILHSHQSMIVGDIQRKLGVLPAQMSRIIRSLENRNPPLIVCQINSNDKRKIDVRISGSGDRALLEYQEIRVRKLAEQLSKLPDADQDELGRLTHKLNEVFNQNGNGVHR